MNFSSKIDIRLFNEICLFSFKCFIIWMAFLRKYFLRIEISVSICFSSIEIDFWYNKFWLKCSFLLLFQDTPHNSFYTDPYPFIFQETISRQLKNNNTIDWTKYEQIIIKENIAEKSQRKSIRNMYIYRDMHISRHRVLADAARWFPAA